MPKVSVIVPVHNAEPYLAQCVDSILGQSLRDIEVILIDDGSVDASPAILAEYASADPRIVLVSQPNQGAGSARNVGLDRAQGAYCVFLDADDYIEPQMLESVYQRCVECDADVALFRSRVFGDAYEAPQDEDGFLRTDMVPTSATFSRDDIPDHIFNIVVPATWNKMFKRSFITRTGLRFQHLHRANDLYFTRMALAQAARITVVNEYLVNYRVGVSGSLQATTDEAPLEFFEALRAVRTGLRDAGILTQVERSYVNDAVSVCLYNLHHAKQFESYRRIYEFLKAEGFKELGILHRTRDYFHRCDHFERQSSIMSLSSEEYLFQEIQSSQRQLGDAATEMDALRAELAGRCDELSESREESNALREEANALREEANALRVELAAITNRLFDALRLDQQEIELATIRHADVEAELRAVENQIKSVRESKSYRLGRKLTLLPRSARRLMHTGPKGGVRRA